MVFVRNACVNEGMAKRCLFRRCLSGYILFTEDKLSYLDEAIVYEGIDNVWSIPNTTCKSEELNIPYRHNIES